MIYNPYPSIELPFGNDNKWFVYLFESLTRVDISFLEYEIQDVDEINAPKAIGAQAHLERVFAYELYRQWMNYLEEQEVRNLVVNGEIGKCLKDDLVRGLKVDKKKGRDIFPDLVLHRSQGSDNQQLMVCEIKREKVNDGDLFLDLLKLSCYINEKMFWKKPFSYGVFILVGKNASLSKIRIKPRSKTTFKGNSISIEDFKNDENFKQHFSNIVCVSYNGKNIEYNTLENLWM